MIEFLMTLIVMLAIEGNMMMYMQWMLLLVLSMFMMLLMAVIWVYFFLVVSVCLLFYIAEGQRNLSIVLFRGDL